MIMLVISHDHGTVSRKGCHKDTVDGNRVLASKHQSELLAQKRAANLKNGSKRLMIIQP